jgi:hypothetical protein
LTGHSKAGGQAQFAAKEFRLKAIVFNSDLVNPVVSTESFFKPPYDALEPNFIKFIDVLFHLGKAIIYCRRTDFDDLPHAPIEWLSDTSTCSANDGHAIATVVRELQACAAVSASQKQ